MIADTVIRNLPPGQRAGVLKWFGVGALLHAQPAADYVFAQFQEHPDLGKWGAWQFPNPIPPWPLTLLDCRVHDEAGCTPFDVLIAVRHFRCREGFEEPEHTMVLNAYAGVPNDLPYGWLCTFALCLEKAPGPPLGAGVYLLAVTAGHEEASQSCATMASLLTGMPPEQIYQGVTGSDATPAANLVRISYATPLALGNGAEGMMVNWLLPIVLRAFALCHCKNVVTQPHEMDPRLVRARGRRGVLTPGFIRRSYTLVIGAPTGPANARTGRDASGQRMSQHIVRGHFKTFTAEKPLLGRHTGTYWWPSVVRGNPARGLVEKDYAIERPLTP